MLPLVIFLKPRFTSWTACSASPFDDGWYGTDVRCLIPLCARNAPIYSNLDVIVFVFDQPSGIPWTNFTAAPSPFSAAYHPIRARISGVKLVVPFLFLFSLAKPNADLLALPLQLLQLCEQTILPLLLLGDIFLAIWKSGRDSLSHSNSW